MTGKPTYEALEAQVSALTKEVSNLEQSQRDFHVLNDSLNTLHEATMDLLEKRDLSDLLAEILTRVTGIFQTDTGFLYLLDEDEDKLVLKVGQGHFAKRIGYRLERGAGLAGRVLQMGKSIVVDDYSAWEGRVPDPFWDTLQSIAGFPIRIQNKTIGVIGIHQIRTEKAISQHELDLIKRFADLASLGLKNAHLYELLQKELIDRKRAEEALRQSEEKYRNLFDTAMVGMYRTTIEDGKVIEANAAFAKIFGYETVEELKKEFATAKSYVNPERREALIELLKMRGSVDRFEIEEFRKDGTCVFVEVSGTLHTDQGYIEGFIVDNTDRKRAEEALRESEEKYRTILESIEDGYYEVDIDGNFTFFNDSLCEIYGYPKNEMMGLNIRKLTDQETAKRGYSLFNKVYTTGRSEKGFEWPITRKDGTHRVVEASVSLRRNGEGVPRGFRGIVRDISEKQKLEAQLQRAQKMEAIGTLAGGVAHDLNNILGGLVSYPELLLFQLPEDSPLRKSILTIQKSGEKAAAVVQDLLTLARRGVVVTEVIKMNAVIAEYLKSPEHENLQSYHPDVHIETHLETDVLNILGSSTHLSKAVMNLVSNAAEAMLEGGALTISTENRYIDRPIRGYDAIKEGDFVVLTISDTGTGISPDDIGKIFEPFYTKKKMGKSGTGLGMAVVWGTVKDHNGYIHVQSAEGKGTTFTLYFPVTRNKLAEDNSKSAIESYSGNGEPILIVDDVEEQRNIAFGMLEELGYSVMSVSSGEEAVEYLKTNKTDLLLLDMIMDPGMDGLDTYKKILEIHPGQKAIIGSGFSETARVKELQSLGAGGYIRKPFLLEKLGLAVKEELEK